MGKLLDIRVQAQTYNEDDVAKTWPRLCSLVWPTWYAKLGLKDFGLAGVSVASPVEASLGQRPHGVVELATALPDLLKFGDLDAALINKLTEPVKQVAELNSALAKALSDWNTKEAVPLTGKLEDALTKAEQSLK